MLRLQYTSDLHIDINKYDNWKKFLVPSAEVLVLAGDIAQADNHKLSKFLKWCTSLDGGWKTVIFLPGNHEYYQKRNSKNSIEETDEKLRTMCEASGVIFAQELDIQIPGTEYHLLACTLWTNIDQHEATVRQRMSDFSKIPGLDIMKWKELNKRHLEWLQAKIEQYGKKSIVVTHHSPLLYGTSKPEHEGTSGDRGFVNDLPHLVEKVGCWIFGHTHHKTNLLHEGVPVLSNPAGYRGEHKNYDPSCVVSLPLTSEDKV